jgi:hypothetical protein
MNIIPNTEIASLQDKSSDQHMSRHFSGYCRVVVAANYFRQLGVLGNDGKQKQAICFMGEE